MNQYILLKTKEQLQKYYIDIGGDAQESKEKFNIWDALSAAEVTYQNRGFYINSMDFGRLILENQLEYNTEEYKWAIDKIITKETHPEYFL